MPTGFRFFEGSGKIRSRDEALASVATLTSTAAIAISTIADLVIGRLTIGPPFSFTAAADGAVSLQADLARDLLQAFDPEPDELVQCQAEVRFSLPDLLAIDA